MPASYSANLTDPKNSPYHLFAGTDSSSNARAALTAWFDEIWPQKEDYGTRRPRVQFIYMVDSRQLQAPIRAVKDQAELFGFKVGPDLDLSIFATDARSQVKSMQRFRPDFVYHGNTSLSVAATLRQATALELPADHIVNSWAFDENLIKLAGRAAEGVMGASVGAFYGQDVSLMDTIKIYGQRYNPGMSARKRSVRTIQAWANVLVLREALKRADSAGDLSGETIMEMGFETFNGVDIGLGVSPLTIAVRVNLYKIA